MKSSHSLAVVCSTRSRSVERNQLSAGRSQCSNVPRSPLQPVNAPLTEHVDRHAAAGGELDRRGTGSPRWGRSARTRRRPCRPDARANSIVAVPRQLAIGMDVPAVDRQERPVDVVPAQAHVAHAAVDFGLHVDGENRAPGFGSLVLDQEPLDVLAGRLFAARVRGQAVAHRGEVGDHDLDRPVPPGQLGRQEVGRSLILLVRVPGRPFREPVEPAADGQAADDRAEMAAALGQVAFLGTDVRMKADRRKIDVVGRAAAVDPDRHQPVADQPLGSQ